MLHLMNSKNAYAWIQRASNGEVGTAETTSERVDMRLLIGFACRDLALPVEE